MTTIWTCVLAFGLLCGIWILLGRLALPIRGPMTLLLPVRGDAAETEQTLYALRCLTDLGTAELRLCLVDQGLTEQGRARCECLARLHHAVLCTEEDCRNRVDALIWADHGTMERGETHGKPF